ncbi:MAG: UDP-glucose dehydrogenase family protein, partial [Chloroflexota bacterium]
MGLTIATGLALRGCRVVGIDWDADKLERLANAESRVTDETLRHALERVSIQATRDYTAVQDSDMTFICVGTPSTSTGQMDLGQVEGATRQVALALARVNSYHLVVVKSTVVPGTTVDRIVPLLAEHSGQAVGDSIGVCMSPEFLREGQELDDFLHPSRLIIGEYDTHAGDRLYDLYSQFDTPILRTDPTTAEMIKYASNAFLATRISFVNEIGNLCKTLGIDVGTVAHGMGLDPRIGSSYLEPGIGFGGSCLPKDVKALIAKARESGYDCGLLQSVLDLNSEQPLRLVRRLEHRAGDLTGKRIAILGLAFKGGTDDVRESPAIPVIGELLARGAQVAAYDPVASVNMEKLFHDIEYAPSARDALAAADACLILADWPEFRTLAREFEAMNSRVILEGRRVLDG